MNTSRSRYRSTFSLAARKRVLLRLVGCCLLLCTAISNAQEVKMYSGINLVLDGNIYFVVNNSAFKNDGNFTAGTSTVKFTGNIDTTGAFVSGNSYTKFNNLTLDKTSYGIALKSSVGVKNVLTVTTGFLYADSNLTLLSDASNTARVATVPTGANIYGKAMVERYFPAKRAWRLLTAPVTSGSSIYKSWQNSGVYSVGRGLLVSGPTGGNGLDNTNTTSIKTWNYSSQSWVPVANTNNSVSPTNNGSADNAGYFVFVRGDRNPANFQLPNTNTTTITSIGRLQVGTQTFPAASTAGSFTLIGNPYASPIDFNMVSRTNLMKRFYVWDPTLNNLGVYVAIDDLDNDGIYSKSVFSSSQTKEIQSSQAFFVQTVANGTASLSISESAKSTTNNSPVFRPLGSSQTLGNLGSMNVALYLAGEDGSTTLADGALVEFGDIFTEGVSSEDAVKMTNANENLGIYRDGATLAMERRPELSQHDTIFLRLWKTTQRGYLLKILPASIHRAGLEAFFEDRYLATRTPMSLVDTSTFSFAVNSNPASADTNRFRIVFKAASVLPVSFASVNAYAMSGQVIVDWALSDETNILRYETERSVDGVTFSPLSATPKNNTGRYSAVDPSPIQGKNYYRVKSVDRSGAIRYSTIVHAAIQASAGNFSIAPNPVRGNIIHLHFRNQPQGAYQLNLVNGSGQSVITSGMQIDNGSNSHDLRAKQPLAAGIYQLQITGPNGQTENQQIVVEQ